MRLAGENRAAFWAMLVGALVFFGTAFAVVYFILPGTLVSETGDGTGRLKRSELLAAENGIRTSGIQLLGGLVVVIGTALTAQSAVRTLRLNRDGQLTERFAAAVDQLGNNKQEVQVGGIHGLARVAYYSPFDDPAIYELLTSHLREKHHFRLGAPRPRAGVPTPRVVQAVAAALTRRRKAKRQPHPRLDLSGVDLCNVNLSGADLTEANLAESNLAGARLENAVLARANLTNAKLDRATLNGADLSNATMCGASAVGAFLDSANLTGADVTDCDLSGPALRRSRGVRLGEALTDADTRA